MKAERQMIDIKEEFKETLEECKESIKREVFRSKGATPELFEGKFEKMQ